MDHLEASRVLYVQLHIFDQLGEIKIQSMSDILVGRLALSPGDDLMGYEGFVADPSDVFTAASPHDLFMHEYPIFI
jgi:hypothetical protein